MTPTQIAAIAAGLTEAQKRYLLAVAASEKPYEPWHGRTANWAIRHGHAHTIVRLMDGREGPWESFGISDLLDTGIDAFLGQKLTALGLAVRAHLKEQSHD